MPRGRFAYNNAMFWPTKGEVKRLDQTEVFLAILPDMIQNLIDHFPTGMQIHENLGLYPKDPGPSWKKWEDKEE